MADIGREGWLLFTKQLMLYSPSGDPGSAGEPEGGTILNCTLEIPLVPKDVRFLPLIDRMGRREGDRYHLESIEREDQC